ncbi:MAG: metal-sensitive transcriptional regulator [Gammaproteobacteria bacterium]|nr:metal-sensitive transcriptional regulator [Gammaproteobacteria bacterium]
MTNIDSRGHKDQGYKDNKKNLLDRLKRVEGQVRGVIGMIEADRYCIDVITQISAAQAALDKVALGLLDDHAHHCVMKAKAGDKDQRAAELMGAIGRLLRRG